MPFTRAVYANRLSGAGVYRRGAYSGSYVQAFTPLQLSNLRAWYDAELGQPKYGGAGAYVQLDGTSGDYIYTPDSAATSFSNDIEVVMRVKVTDWTAAANQTLAGKYVSTGNQRSWRFYVNTSGAIGLTASTDGTAVTSIIVTPTNALPDNTWIWLRMRLDLTNGPNSVGTLETATDAGTNTEPSSWTANGTNTGTTISGIFDSTAPTEIGTFAAGTLERLTGQVGRCIVRNGFDGTTVSDFNASDCYGDGYWHSGGYRWTLGLPKIYDRSGNNVAPATFGSGSNQPKWLPWESRAQVFIPSGGIANRIDVTLDPAAYVTGDVEIEFVEWHAPLGTGSLFELMGPPTIGGYAVRMLGGGEPYFVYTDGTTYHNVISTVALPTYFTGGGKGCLRVRRVAASGVVTFEVKQANADSYTLLDSVAGSTSPIYSASFYPVGGFNVNGGVTMNDVLCGDMYLRDGIDGDTALTFNAELCGQSGYTDTLGNVWTVNRATTGRKTVVQSPTARSARSVIMHGTDDWIDVPAAAQPPMNASQAYAVSASARAWNTHGGYARIWCTRAAGGATKGADLSFDVGGSNNLAYFTGDGTSVAFRSLAWTAGQRSVVELSADGTDNRFRLNGASATPRAQLVDTNSGTASRIGATTAGANVVDMEFEALVLRDAATTDTEHGLLVAYYGGGLL